MISVWNLEGWSDCKLRRLKKENFTKNRISSVKHLNPPSTDSEGQMYETALSRVMSKGRGCYIIKKKVSPVYVIVGGTKAKQQGTIISFSN